MRSRNCCYRAAIGCDEGAGAAACGKECGEDACTTTGGNGREDLEGIAKDDGKGCEKDAPCSHGGQICDECAVATDSWKECDDAEAMATDAVEGCDEKAVPSDELYKVGQVLELRILSHGASCNGDEGSIMRARIRKIVSRTWSIAVAVDIENEQGGRRPAFLKLYDRRCSEDARIGNAAKTWAQEIDDESISALQEGSIFASIATTNPAAVKRIKKAVKVKK